MKRWVMVTSLIAIALLTTVAYHVLKPDWVLFRNAERRFSNKAYAQAIPLYNRLLDNGFETPSLLNHLGTSYIATGQFSEAATIFENILKRNPSMLPAMTELAQIYVAFGRFQNAIPLYQSFLDKQPDNRSVRILLARVLSWSGRLDEAVVQYRKALGDER